MKRFQDYFVDPGDHLRNYGLLTVYQLYPYVNVPFLSHTKSKPGLNWSCQRIRPFACGTCGASV